MPEKLEGSYCPLCGEVGLLTVEKSGFLWAYCARLGDTLETSHTSYRVHRIDRPAKPAKEELNG